MRHDGKKMSEREKKRVRYSSSFIKCCNEKNEWRKEKEEKKKK